jgi:hypothetical protein
MKASTAAAVLLVACALLTPTIAAATTRGTPAEAEAMLAKAVDHYEAVGRERALSDFTAGTAPFRDRDLYVVCVDSKHIIVANGGYPSYVGTSADALVDAKGVPLGKALWDAANEKPKASIEYPHVNPVTKKIEDKTTFYCKVADDLLCGVGAYSAH